MNVVVILMFSEPQKKIASVISLSCEIILLLDNYSIVPGQSWTSIYVSRTVYGQEVHYCALHVATVLECIYLLADYLYSQVPNKTSY